MKKRKHTFCCLISNRLVQSFGMVVLVLFAVSSVTAQDEAIPNALQSTSENPNVVDQKAFLQFVSGKSAASFGFSSISETILKDLLVNEPNVADSLKNEIRYQLILSLLNQRKLSEAKMFHTDWLEPSDPYRLFVTILIAYIEDDYQVLKSGLDDIDGEALGDDQVWLQFLKGVVKNRDGFKAEAKLLFDQAIDQSVNSFQQSWLETLKWREEIFNGQADEALGLSLRNQIENAVNPMIASQLTQQYAIVLNALGRKSDAIEAIEKQLSLLNQDYREQEDRLLLLLAILSGQKSGKSRIVIEDILQDGKSQRVRSMAYYMWLADADFTEAGMSEMLFQLYEARPNDPLKQEIAYALAMSYFYRGNFDHAKRYINEVLESDGNKSLKSSALQVLIAVCWSQDPPQYRLAAEHLLRLRREFENEDQWDYYTLLVADSYYLNGDFDSAIPYYNEVVNDASSTSTNHELLYKMTDSFLQVGNIDGIRPILDQFHAQKNGISELIWGSEWNFNLHLLSIGQLKEATERISTLYDSLSDNRTDDWRVSAQMRGAWLLSFLLFQQEKWNEALQIIENVSTVYNASVSEEDPDLTGVFEEILVMKARVMFSLNREDEALDLLAQVRKGKNRETAASTYIIEARYYFGKPDNLKAQRVLMRLSDRYPDSKYAPVALYEAAINIEKRGDASGIQESIELYERISNEFRDHPLSFVSKLRQGNLLRESNQFAPAIQLYESMQREYRDDPRMYLVDIAIGESYLAMGSSRIEHVDQAILILERVFDLAHLPLEVRIEAGTKAAIGLDRVGRSFRSTDLLWRIVTLHDEDPSSIRNVGATGKYWLARATLLLSEDLEQNGSKNEIRRLVQMSEAMNLPGTNLIRNKL